MAKAGAAFCPQARIAAVVAATEKARGAGAAAGAAEDAGARDLDLAQLAAENILAERVGLDMSAAVADAELRREGLGSCPDPKP